MDRRRRLVPELVREDLEGVPMPVLGGLMALLSQLEAYRPLTDEELSTREVVETERAARNQLYEERFGRPTARIVQAAHAAVRQRDATR